MWCFKVPGRAGLALAVWLATHLVCSTALAYCRARTCSLGKTAEHALVECAHEDGCISEGKPLHWPSPCLRYAVQVDGSPSSGLDADQVAELVEQAFALWRNAECPQGGKPRFEAASQGFVTCDQQEAVCAGASGNVNVVMFHDDDWPHDWDALGVTSPTATTGSGLLTDADIEINSQRIASSSAAMVELLSVMTHEVGHFLGLAHSSVPGSLMLPDYMTPVMPDALISDDDAAGICAIYPPLPLPLSCNTPAPAYDACKSPSSVEACSLSTVRHDSGGCSIGATPSRPASGGLIVLAVAAVALCRRPIALRLSRSIRAC